MARPGEKKSDADGLVLTQESAKDGRGDGWTLDQHLVEHVRLPSHVKFADHEPGLSITHKNSGRWKAAVGLAALPLPFVALVTMGFWPVMKDNPVILGGSAFVACALAVLLLSKATAVTKITLNPAGLRSAPWPPGATGGERFTVSLEDLRRFKVGKTKHLNQTVYQLHLHTRRGDQHTLIPVVPLKRDAYLMAMLLIEHVKRLRAEHAMG